MKKVFVLVSLLLICVSLAACGENIEENSGEIVGDDWRVTGIVRDYGSITRDGEDTDVLVCLNADGAVFYYDTEVQTVYGQVEYPTPFQSAPWEEFRSIDFADRSGDRNGDVAIMFEVDGQQVLMVWFWDADAGEYVFQPDESQF